MYTVYYHRNKINGKIYVSSTSLDVEKRWQDGRGYKRCPKMEQAISEYGWDCFDHIIVKTGLSKEEAVTLESETIKQYNAADDGYNMTYSGGSAKPTPERLKRIKETTRGENNPNWGRFGPDNPLYGRRGKGTPMWGKKHSTETKEKISDSIRGEKNPFWGKKHTVESRKKMSAALQGDKHPCWGRTGNKHPLSRAVININTGKKFSSAVEAEIYFNTNRSDIRKCCKGIKRSAGKHPETGEKLYWQYCENKT
jgi:group I intron endonuclease